MGSSNFVRQLPRRLWPILVLQTSLQILSAARAIRAQISWPLCRYYRRRTLRSSFPTTTFEFMIYRKHPIALISNLYRDSHSSG
ncbi:hypothetical protein DFH08DRAFT_856990 [Mycena albidolilacea]|uniref:Uncharacterized protein n=1 Tax=Mycena albidolilacea TaxID=1033008 RepID=A0AAD7ABL6_9AGAR|nr:hypothetical protein DFH08DRAFT_856990 [Mycena albidolilacea]